MNYGKIINSAFRLAWRYKSLWLLGLFAGGGIAAAFSWTDETWDTSGTEFDFESFEPSALFSDLSWAVPAVLAIVFLMVIAQVLLNAICTPALIDAVNRLTRGGVYNLGNSLSTGIDFMWRVLATIILHALSYIGTLSVLILIGVFFGILLATIHAALIVLLILVAIPIIMALVFVLETIFGLAYRAMVVRNINIGDALTEGYTLLLRQPLSCLAMFALIVGLWILIAICETILVTVIGLPLYLAADAAGIGLVPILLIGVPLFLLISLPVAGFLGAVFEAMYTLFYFRLLEPQPSVVPVR